MLFLLTLLLGSAFAPRGRNRGRCREGDDDIAAVDLALQDQHLIDALAPFTEAPAADDDDTSDGGSTDDVSALFTVSDNAPTSTVCRMGGVSRHWPHENAEPENSGRRLLHWGGWGRRHRRRGKIAFDVTSQAFSPPQKKKRRNNYDCMNDGSVTMSVKSVDFVLSDALAQAAAGDPRRQLDDSSETETPTTPYAVVVITQSNSFADDDGAVVPVDFDVTYTCMPMYKVESDVCVEKGVSCRKGTYTYFYDDSEEDEQQSRTKSNVSLKCSHVADFFDDNFPACVAP